MLPAALAAIAERTSLRTGMAALVPALTLMVLFVALRRKKAPRAAGPKAPA
jgi:hypothetical protein